MEFFDGYIGFPRKISIGSQGKLLNTADLEAYTQRFGQDRLTGYLEALNDFNAYAETILGGGYCRNGVEESPHMVKKYLKELVEHNQIILAKYDFI